MTDNFEFALSKATGAWISIIGDDDGILPSGLERGLKVLHQTGMRALSSAVCQYRWPDRSNDGPDMFLSIPYKKGFTIRRTGQVVESVLSRRVSFVSLPMLYTGGLISRILVDEGRDELGRFFNSRTPDVFSGFRLCGMVDNFITLHEPLFVAGQSSHSTGFNVARAEGSTYDTEDNLPYHKDLLLEDNESISGIISLVIFEAFLQSRQADQQIPDDVFRRQLAIARVALSKKRSLQTNADNILNRIQVRLSKEYGKHRTCNSLDLFDASINHALNLAFRRANDLAYQFRITRSMSDTRHNVYDACVFAENILRQRPSLIRNQVNSALRILKGFSSRSACLIERTTNPRRRSDISE